MGRKSAKTEFDPQAFLAKVGAGKTILKIKRNQHVFQQGDDFVAVVELPGVDKADLQIEAKENTIRISGKKIINDGEGASIHRRERVWGVFDRTFSIPIQIEPDGIRAEYRDGILALHIPRAESQKPRTIKIG